MKIKTIIVLILLAYSIVATKQICNLSDENSLLQTNQETLLSDIKYYKIADSINVAQIGELTLSLNDYKKYRTEDAALIKKLKTDKIASANSVKAETKIDSVLVAIHDTLYIDTRARVFDYKSKWTDISGIILQDSVLLSIANREELIITESFKKKRFWFIKLPAWLFGYADKRIDIISKNPNTVITDAEHIIIK